jgi:hypothetical protein
MILDFGLESRMLVRGLKSSVEGLHSGFFEEIGSKKLEFTFFLFSFDSICFTFVPWMLKQE